MASEPKLTAALVEFLSQNDNDMLDEESDETLWVCIGGGSTAHALEVLLQNSDRETVAEYRVTIEQVNL